MKSRLFGRLPLTAVATILVLVVGMATAPTMANSPISYEEGHVAGKGAAIVFNDRANPAQVPGRYIVRFSEDPVPVYFAAQAAGGNTKSGNVYKAQGANGRVRLDMSNPAVTGYAQLLRTQQTQHLKDISTALGRNPDVSRTMQYALNAAVVEGLSSADVKKIASVPGVASIRPDILRPIQTDIGPGFIGASSVWWNAEAGQDTIFATAFEVGNGYRGDGVVIGDIDTGYNSLSPSFAATDDKGYAIQNPLGAGTYIGQCGVAGINAAGGCNNKVIGVYDELGVQETGENAQSVEDSTLDGHGSHTGSTAGGNSRSATISNYTAELSGVAPHANMVIYRACYNDQCAESATAGSADQAIQDGVVDALNYSISGGTDPWNDPTSLAFLSAADAGIFVAAAGGNTGTSVPVAVPGSVNHSEPWVTTAAAGTHTGGPLVDSLNIVGPPTAPVASLFATFTGSAYTGFTTAIPNSPLVVSPQFENTDTSGTDSCTAYTGTPFQGQIVVLSRGSCTFAIKAQNVQAAGAVALVMSDNRVEDVTQQAFTFSATPVSIPAFFVSQSDGSALQAYLTANTGVTAAIPLVSRRFAVQPDVLAGFSLLGPGAVDVIKPDIQAPGVNILASVANDPTLEGPNSVAFYNGTSMATPHTTGAGALLLGLHPDWSPLEAKSAIMMTAKEVGLTEPDGVTPSTYFDRGSGRIQAFVASKAGLVLNETGLNFTNANPATGGNPATLNLASMQSSSCITVTGTTSTPTCSFTRKFRSTQDHAVTWTPSFTGDVTATAPALIVPAHANGQPLQINVDATAYDSDGVFHFGEMTLTPSDTTLSPLHLTMAIKVPVPTISATPSSLTISIPMGSTGSSSLTIKNLGGPTLNVTSTNDTIGVTHAVVLDQPQTGENGFYSTRWTDFGGIGPYGADDFAVVGPSSNLTKLSFPGFVTGGGSLASFPGNKIHFEIYNNASGIPSGQPEDPLPSYRWTFVATIGTTPGLSIAGQTISIDLAAAGATPTALPAGTYWMVVYPELAYGTAGVGWAWFESSTVFGNDAQNIDPDQLFQGSTGQWTDNTATGDLPSFAMHIEQAVTCGAPWLSTTPPSLTLGGELSAPVTVNVDSTVFPVGQTSAAAVLCMDSNDPVNPIYAVPVTANAPQGGSQPPTVAKSFSPPNVKTGTNSTVTITLSNGNSVVDTLTSALTDTLPGGVIATAGTAATTCTSGTASIGSDGTSIALASGAQIPAQSSCTVTATVTSSSANTYTNTIAAGGLQTDRGNNTAAASADLTVTQTIPPSITKAFSPTGVNTNTPSTLTITLSNANAAAATLTSALTDTFPTGLVVSPIPVASTTCTGTATVTAVAGGGSVALSTGAQIPANSSCTVTVNVQSATGSTYANTIAVGALVTNAGSNAAAANASLTVTVPLIAPSIAKAFSPTSVTTGAASTLTITLSNSNASADTLMSALTDTFPSGLVVASTPAASTTCTGTVTAAAGAGSIALSSGAQIPAGGCTVAVNVSAASANTYSNTIAIGALATNAGSNAAAANATLTVTVPLVAPTVGVVFSPTSVALNAASTVTLTLSNSNASALTLNSDFVTPLPTGLVVAATPNATTTCGSTVTANANDTSITLPASGASIPANGSCTFSVAVQSAAAAPYSVDVNSGALQTNGGNNATMVGDNLVVTGTFPAPFCPITFTQSGGVEPITQITITSAAPGNSGNVVNNTTTNTTVQSIDYTAQPLGVSMTARGGYSVTANVDTVGNFTDYVTVYFDWNHDGSFEDYAPTVVGSITNATGTSSSTAISNVIIVPPTARPGLTRMRVAHVYGGSGSDCGENDYGQAEDFLVNVDNTITPPPAPPLVATAFSPNYVTSPSGTSTLTVTLTNYNSTDLPLTAAFVHDLDGLVVASVPNASTTCPSGVVTAIAGAGTVTLRSGAIIPANPGTCTFQFDVTSTGSGIYVDDVPPGSVVTANGSNPSDVESIIQFADPNNLPTYSTGFELPFTTGALTNGIQDWGSGSSAGSIVTTLPDHGLNAAKLTSTANGGTTGTQPYIVSPAFVNGTSPYSSLNMNFAIIPPTTATNTTLQWELDTVDSDTNFIGASLIFQSGTVSGVTQPIEILNLVSQQYELIPGATWASSTSSALTYANLQYIINRSTFELWICVNGTQIFHDTTGNYVGDSSISGMQLAQDEVPSGGASATGSTFQFDDVIMDNGPNGGCGLPAQPIAPGVQATQTPATVAPNAVSTRTITLVNSGNSHVANLTQPFVDVLPSGLVVASTPTPATTCMGGTLTAVANSGSVTLGTGAQIPASAAPTSAATCTITYGVQSSTPNIYESDYFEDLLITDQGPDQTEVSLLLNVANPPTVSIAFSPSSISLATATTSTLTITVNNANPQTATISSNLTDTLSVPAGLTVASPVTSATTCTGATFKPVANAATIPIPRNAVIPGNGSCTFTVLVKATTANSYVDTIAAAALVTSNGSNAAAAAGTLTVTP